MESVTGVTLLATLLPVCSACSSVPTVQRLYYSDWHLLPGSSTVCTVPHLHQSALHCTTPLCTALHKCKLWVCSVPHLCYPGSHTHKSILAPWGGGMQDLTPRTIQEGGGRNGGRGILNRLMLMHRNNIAIFEIL